jgi:small-conductance mechanosensitive channel
MPPLVHPTSARALHVTLLPALTGAVQRWWTLLPMRRLFPILILVGWCPAALAAPVPAATPAVSVPVDKVSAADMQNVLDVLNDPQKRAAFTKTLEAMVHATHAAAPKSVPVAAVPLVANSVGAEVIRSSEGWVANLSGQAKALRRMMGDLPEVWAFTTQTFTDPARRADALDAGEHLAVVVLVAGAVEWIFHFALRRPIAALARRAPDAPPPAVLASGGTAPVDSKTQETADAVAEEAHDAADAAQAEAVAAETVGPEVSVGRQRRLARTMRLLRRVPLMLARLLLELLPVAVFLGLTFAGLSFLRPDTQDVLWVAITAYVGLRVAVVVARTLTAPNQAALRVVPVSDAAAHYAVRWVRRLAAVVAIAYAGSVIGTDFGMSAAAREGYLKAVALLFHILLIIVVIQCRHTVAAAIRRAAGEAGWGAAVGRRLAAVWHLIAIFLIAGQWLVWAARVPNGYERMWRIFLGTAAVVAVWRVLGNVLLGGLERLFNVTPERASRYPGLEHRAHFYLPLLRRTVAVLLWLAAALALLEAWGVNSLAWFSGRALGGKLAGAGGSILLVGLLMLLVWEAANAHIERRLARLVRNAQTVQAARLRTLMPILRTVLVAVLLAVFALNALSEIGVDVAPLLAGAGILGVAIGFGSQKLVQDFITGIFLLLENAMQVGDNVTVAGLSGTVENLSIRTMRLRAGDGSVHIIPFSSVTTVTNVNRGIGNVPVSVTVPPESDTDHVSDVLADVAREMRAERRYADMMLSDFQLWGVDKLEPGAVTVAGQIVCTDGGRWPVQREFNRRMLRRFRVEGIRLTSAAQTVRTFTQPLTPPLSQPQPGEALPPGAQPMAGSAA